MREGGNRASNTQTVIQKENKNIIDVGDPCFQFCQLKCCPKFLQFLDLSSHLFFTILGHFGQFLAVLGRHFGSGKICWSEKIVCP